MVCSDTSCPSQISISSRFTPESNIDSIPRKISYHEESAGNICVESLFLIDRIGYKRHVR